MQLGMNRRNASNRPQEPGRELQRSEAAPRAAEGTALRRRVLSGGLFLAVREGLGVVVALVGSVLLTRIIGPADFGVYVAILALFGYVHTVAAFGINTFLVRSEGELHKRMLDEAFTLLLALSVAVTVIAELILQLIAAFTQLPGLETAGRYVLLALPFVVISQVPLARLEHDLEFRQVAVMEAIAQVLLYAVALPLAVAGWGALAAIVGWLVQQFFLISARFMTARYWPSLQWSRGNVKMMLGYGASFSTSIWVWQLRTLVNPLIVGRYMGAEAVGMVGLAIRLVEQLGFIKRVAWRMSMAVLGRVQREPSKVLTFIQDGMSMQLLALGPPLVLFACVGGVIVPAVYGDEWLPTLGVLPFVALGYLVNATFNLHSSALFVIRRNWSVTRFHLVHIVLLSASAYVFVPSFGLLGYGLAELVALPSYCLIHRSLRTEFGSPAYQLTALWLTCLGLALFAPQTTWWTLLALGLMLAWPGTWRDIGRNVSMLRRTA